jgi:probable HAF family extracellular repeat protein
MKTISILIQSFGMISLVFFSGARCIATEPVPAVVLEQKADASYGGLMSMRSLNGLGQGQHWPPRHVGHVLNLTHGKANPDAPGVNTIPHWSDSFTYNGLVYNYTMVGTDPRRGSATTVIPTVLIPLRFVFADGKVFDASTDLIDGQTSIQGIINSPIFQNYNFNNTSVHVGNTQWGDAFQRANFWDSVSTSAPNYHVLLGQPTVLPTQTVNVPFGSFFYFTDFQGRLVPVVDSAFLFNQVNPILAAANVSPNSLPIMVWGKIITPDFGALHGVTSLHGTDLQTFIGTGYYYANFDAPDVYVLSHEIAEWMDDPFTNNFTPGWDFPFVSTDQRCDSSFATAGDAGLDLLEVADPVAIFVESSVALPGGTFTYHVTEAMFIDFYSRSIRSRSYNGQYSFFEIGAPFGLLTGPSAVCAGHVEFTPTLVDFPGATFTTVTGINNAAGAVGFYNDTGGMEHGFFFNGSKYSTLDFPGALFTDPFKINDAGMIVGTFADASGGLHGFSYTDGAWKQIDFPGSHADTEVTGVNSAGAIVGIYDLSQPVERAFLLQTGQYQDIANPFGPQTNAFAINDAGSITGIGYTDPYPSAGPFTPFILSRKTFSPFQFPGSVTTRLSSINNGNDLAGSFRDPDGTRSGMVTVNGSPYQVFALVWGNNDLQQICGSTFDSNGQEHGFIGTLPLQRSR